MPTTPPIEKPVLRVHDLPAEKLIKALYWLLDAFGRATMNFFLVHQTYKDAKANHDLTGDKVEVGVRRNEWVSGGRSIFNIFVNEPLFEDENKVEYNYFGVPVIIHIYEDSECIIALDTIHYRYEQFKTPNPYSQFETIYG